MIARAVPHPYRPRRAADVLVGYATETAGRGIAFAAVATGSERTVVRIPFALTPLAGLDGRDAGYAATAAVLRQLRARGFERIRLRLRHPGVVAELAGQAAVPPALAMPYVRLRCELHAFAQARIERADPLETRSLEERARAELAVRAAA